MIKGRICVFGDSITYGASDMECGGWVNRLRLYFNRNNNDISVYNLGIEGDTSRGLLLRIEEELINREPEIVMIAIGINDSSYTNKPIPPINQFKNNINSIINIIKKYTNKIYIIGLTPVDEEKTQPWLEDRYYTLNNIKEYDKGLESTANNNKLTYIKLLDKLNINDLDDGLHPNNIGHKKICECVINSLGRYNE